MVLDMWSEKALLSICKKGESDANYQVLITNIETPSGEKGFESIANLAGGRIKKFTPQEDIEITLEGYAVEVGTDTGTTGKGFFDLMHTGGSSQPLSISVDHSRDEYRMALMVTDNSSQTSAADATSDGDKAMRFVFKNGHFTKVDASMSPEDGLKFSITYKVPPFDKSGNANVTYESTDGTSGATLEALGNYS